MPSPKKSRVSQQKALGLARLMKAKREELKIPVKSMASDVGVLEKSISNWENAKVPPTPENLARYCEVLVSRGCPRVEARLIFEFAYDWISFAHSDNADFGGYNALPHRWMRTNHSSSGARWVVASESDSEWATRVVSTHYLNLVSGKISVQSPTHVSSSDVFRVGPCDGKSPDLFIKRFRHRPDPKEHEAYVRICEKVASTFPLGEFLLPLRALSGRTWIKDQEDAHVVAYRFIPGVADGAIVHFEGQYLEELCSVGRALGRLNDRLSGESSLGSKGYVNSLAGWQDLLTVIRKGWKIPTRSQYVAQADYELLSETYRQVATARLEPGLLCSASDVHPHNIFMADGECQLIFDFGVRSDWPEVASAVFTLHRSCREFVRRSLRAGGGLEIGEADELSVVRSATWSFLDGYFETRSCVRQELLEQGALWAKAMTLAKLRECFNSQLLGRQEPYGRPEGVVFGEIVKFLSHLRELDLFQIAMATQD